MPGNEGEQQFLSAEHLIRSGELKKEPASRPSSLHYGVYLARACGKVGPGHVMYWITAVLLVISSGIVVLHQPRDAPLERGSLKG